MAGDGVLRDAATLLASAVEQTLEHAGVADVDAAVVQLARRYAAAIDRADVEADALKDLGPKLLAVLEELHATPAARARRKSKSEGSGDRAEPSRLQTLRDARR